MKLGALDHIERPAVQLSIVRFAAFQPVRVEQASRAKVDFQLIGRSPNLSLGVSQTCWYKTTSDL
ncbi:MAG: hypothetical protein CFE43_21260 [Burkholderiales bacterium PBB3]|nr:MAG: hypothetical protein CFE43_21260 [Burkholderiales bacterium PBB3]